MSSASSPSSRQASAGSRVRAGPYEHATPNLLTGLRVVLAIVFFAILTPWSYKSSPLAQGNGPDWWLLSAASVFIIAAITDALDGYLARRWNAVTTFGRIMDPFADKLLIIGAFVFLAGPGFTHTGAAILHVPGKPPSPENVSGSVTGVHAWMVAVIIARELLVTSIRAEAEGRGISFGADISGKLKMITQSVCVPAVLILLNMAELRPGAGPSGLAAYLILGCVWVTVAVTAWSGVPYVVRAVRVLGPVKEPKG